MTPKTLNRHNSKWPEVKNKSIHLFLMAFLCIPAGWKTYMTPRRPIGVLWRGWVVLDSKSRNIPEVVIVRRGAGGVLGIGGGWVSGGRVGQTGSVYKQPEREVDDSCHNRRVPSKYSRREHKGGQGETSKGEGSKGKCAMYMCNCIVCATEWLNVWMTLVSCI